MSDYIGSVNLNNFGVPRKVDIYANNGRVIVKVTSNDNRWQSETVLMEYQNNTLAEISARNLLQVMQSGDLFDEGVIEVDSQKGTVVIDKSWLPWNSTVIVDYSSDTLDERERAQKVDFFMRNLWASGIFLNDPNIIREQIATLEKQIPYRFRDYKSQGRLDLANLYLSLGNHQQAEAAAQEIIDNQYFPTLPRPLFYDEAIFLVAGSKRIQAMQYWSNEFLWVAAQTLMENANNLRSLESGYRTHYYYEMLETCRAYREIFEFGTDERLESFCSLEATENYLTEATLTNNRLSPLFDDNFLGIKSILTHADILQAIGTEENIRQAIQEYEQALNYIDFIIDPSSIINKDPITQYALYQNYMHKNDRFLFEHLGEKAGIWSYAIRAAINSSIRSLGKSKQFDPNFFQFLKARVLWRQALAHKKLGETEVARKKLEMAFAIAQNQKFKSLNAFYSPASQEERDLYNQIALALADMLSQTDPARAKKITQEVMSQQFSYRADHNLLKALLLMGNITEMEAHRTTDPTKYQEAASYYLEVINRIKLARDKNGPSHFLNYFEAVATIKMAALYQLLPGEKSEQDLQDMLEQVKEAETLLNQLPDKERQAASYLRGIIQMIKADLQLALASINNNQNLLEEAARSYEELSQSGDPTISNWAKVKLLQTIVQQGAYRKRETISMLIQNYELFVATLPPRSFIRTQAALLLQVLYIFRKEDDDADKVINLSQEIVDFAKDLHPNSYFKVYLETYAAVNQAITLIQRGTKLFEDHSKVIRHQNIGKAQQLQSAYQKVLNEAQNILLKLEQKLPEISTVLINTGVDANSLAAEIFHQLAIVYSILENKEPQKYRGKTYEYTQKAYRAIALSRSPYDYDKAKAKNCEEVMECKKTRNCKKDIPDEQDIRYNVLLWNFFCSAYGPDLYPTHPEYSPFMQATPLSYTPDERGRATWENWKKLFIQPMGNGALVKDLDPFTAENRKFFFSERSAYGMFIATMFNEIDTAKELFAGIETYGKKSNGLYTWKLTLEGKIPEDDPESMNSATDADLYIAYAARKLDPERAQELLDRIWEHEIIERGGYLIILPSDGDWPRWGDGKVVFNPSYFAPALLKELAAFDKNPNHNWQKVIDDGYQLMNAILSANIGLSGLPIPDTVLVEVVEGEFKCKLDKKGQTGLDAIRVMLEIGRDAIVNHDPRAIALLRTYVEKSGVRNPNQAKIQGHNNELAIALYAVALKGAGDPYKNVDQFIARLESSFRKNHFGMRPDGSDAKQYYKQSLILMARMLLL